MFVSLARRLFYNGYLAGSGEAAHHRDLVTVATAKRTGRLINPNSSGLRPTFFPT